jgi:hypothetical protein
VGVLLRSTLSFLTSSGEESNLMAPYAPELTARTPAPINDNLINCLRLAIFNNNESNKLKEKK